MTICVATLFNWNYAPAGQPPQFNKAAIAVSDRMITAGDVEYEPQQLKVSYITRDALILIAGDYSLHSEALASVYRTVQQTQKATASQSCSSLWKGYSGDKTEASRGPIFGPSWIEQRHVFSTTEGNVGFFR